MATALFVGPADLKKKSPVSGNLDEDKMVQYIELAQDKRVQPYMGTDLYNRIKAGVIADDLTANETTLLNDYIKDMTIYWGLVEYFTFAPYQVTNAGVNKSVPENAQPVDRDEVDRILTELTNTAQFYSGRFVEYMCANSSLFPEYSSNTNEDIDPIGEVNYLPWQL